MQLKIHSEKKGDFIITYDDDDHALVSMYNWYVSKHHNCWYAVNRDEKNGVKTSIYMHRLIMNAPKGIPVDHRDNNGLNNCKSNLRLATFAQNNTNRDKRKDNKSGFKGVSWCKMRGSYVANISYKKKKIHIGHSESKIEAAMMYNQKAIELYGEFAKINIIQV